jgi:hypothetical protein
MYKVWTLALHSPAIDISPLLSDLYSRLIIRKPRAPLTIALSPSNPIMLRFWRYALVGVISTCALVQAAGEDDDDPTMGPAAFMWPSDRPWSADVDNLAPCGSSAGVGNRTNYPLCTSQVRPFVLGNLATHVLTRSLFSERKTRTGTKRRYFEAPHQCSV